MFKAQCSIFKKTLFYKHIYHPYRVRKEKAFFARQHAVFIRHGAEALIHFAQCMQEAGLDYWLEFGTLLGAYRDGDFVPNETDLDVGAYLQDAPHIHRTLTKGGFRLVREFHVIGTGALEQTYEYMDVTLDVMYFRHEEDEMWCYGAVIPMNYRVGVPFRHQVTSHHFRPFTLSKMPFLGTEMSVPANTEEHLIEIFGSGYKVYDPNFKGDLNKIYYSMEEMQGIGFFNY
jgi:hypothetical protein